MGSMYNRFMKPLERRGIQRTRKRLMKEATGDILELGAGTGANLPFYHMANVSSLVLSDQTRNKHLFIEAKEKVSFVAADATNLPFDDDTFDVVVHTLVFCSVDNVNLGLQEIKRVLKPNGTLLFIEHVLPHNKGYRRLFKVVNPVWRLFSKGCSLTKDFAASLAQENFKVEYQGRFMNTVFLYGKATVNKTIV